MRDRIVAGNWKMNKTLDEGLSLTSEIVSMITDEVRGNVKVVISPPFPFLKSIEGLLSDSENVFLGAQNCNDHESGAYTGEVSPAMLKSVGVRYVIIGHSERRQYFSETDEILATKVDLVQTNAMIPIFCCGETLETRQKGDHFEYVCDQLTNGIFHLDEEHFRNLVVAYEPIWAIGTGVTASPEQAQEMHKKLRDHIAGKYGTMVAEDTTILYGGSCNAKNASELFEGPDVDGGLIGGAALKSRDFIEIIKARR